MLGGTGILPVPPGRQVITLHHDSSAAQNPWNFSFFRGVRYVKNAIRQPADHWGSGTVLTAQSERVESRVIPDRARA